MIFKPFLNGVSLEQRRYPRYQLVVPLVGFVEQAGGRYSGSVLNISEGGFYIHLPKAPPDSLKIHGMDDYGEVHYAGRNAFGFGSIVRIEKFSDSVGIGFSWDKDGMDAKSVSLIGDVIGEQEHRRTSGRVIPSGNTIVLRGHLSSALSQELFAVVRTIGVSQAQISLAECTSIDSSGIELLMALRDRGVPVVNIGRELEGVLQRFQLVGQRKATDAG